MINSSNSFSVFIVQSLDAAKAFYLNHFEFGLAFENEWYLQLILKSGVQVGFLRPNQPTQPNIFQQSYNGNRVIFCLEDENADSAYAEAK